eukprot:scaffold12087_cov62-Phaeocystis_antarctica.AAC.3
MAKSSYPHDDVSSSSSVHASITSIASSTTKSSSTSSLASSPPPSSLVTCGCAAARPEFFSLTSGGADDRATQSAASSAVTKQPRLALAFPVGHAEVARRVLGRTQRQPLCLRLLQRLLARQRHCRWCLLRRRTPLRQACDAQRRLLGGGEVAQVHSLATAAHLHP